MSNIIYPTIKNPSKLKLEVTAPSSVQWIKTPLCISMEKWKLNKI